MFHGIDPDTMDEQVSGCGNSTPALVARHIFNETCRPFITFNIKQFNNKAFVEPLLQPFNLQGIGWVLRVDKADRLGMPGQVLGIDRNNSAVVYKTMGVDKTFLRRYNRKFNFQPISDR